MVKCLKSIEFALDYKNIAKGQDEHREDECTIVLVSAGIEYQISKSMFSRLIEDRQHLYTLHIIR
jgi:hypothetical protein